MRKLLLLFLFLLCHSSSAHAEWQVRPFLQLTFGGDSTYVGDVEQAVGTLQFGTGISAMALGNIFGVEGDVGYVPGFYQTGTGGLVLNSSLTTITGNLVVAAPRRMTQYTLRPYIVGGFGLIRSETTTFAHIFELSRSVAAFDIGGGASGFLTRRVGVNWDLRYFRNLPSSNDLTLTVPDQGEHISFFRASMGLIVRF